MTSSPNEVKSLYIRNSYQFWIYTQTQRRSATLSVHFRFRLYIASLPLRSCQTIGAPSVQGSAQCLFFRFWQQQDSNPGDYHADVLLLRHCSSNSVDKMTFDTSPLVNTFQPCILMIYVVSAKKKPRIWDYYQIPYHYKLYD